MKATKATIRARVNEVLRLRIAGAQFQDIRDYANAPDRDGGPWNVSDSQLRRYIAASDQLLDQTLEKKRERLFNLHVARRSALYARAVKADDWRAALQCLKDEAELLNLYPGKLSARDVAALGAQLVALACRRMPPQEHAAFADEVRAVLSTLEQQ
jgi:hypothetical protein